LPARRLVIVSLEDAAFCPRCSAPAGGPAGRARRTLACLGRQGRRLSRGGYTPREGPEVAARGSRSPTRGSPATGREPQAASCARKTRSAVVGAPQRCAARRDRPGREGLQHSRRADPGGHRGGERRRHGSHLAPWRGGSDAAHAGDGRADVRRGRRRSGAEHHGRHALPAPARQRVRRRHGAGAGRLQRGTGRRAQVQGRSAYYYQLKRTAKRTQVAESAPAPTAAQGAP